MPRADLQWKTVLTVSEVSHYLRVFPVNPAQHAVCIESGDGGLMGN